VGNDREEFPSLPPILPAILRAILLEIWREVALRAVASTRGVSRVRSSSFKSEEPLKRKKRIPLIEYLQGTFLDIQHRSINEFEQWRISQGHALPLLLLYYGVIL
jgi:hypothetical protein